MKKTVKIIAISIGTLLCSIILFIIVYDLLVFQPYSSYIQQMIHNTHPFYRNPSKTLVDIATLAEGKQRIRSFVARSLLIQWGWNHQKMLTWHLDYLLWTVLIEIHVHNDEIFALWCYFAPYEHGVGLNESANFYYKRNLDQLSPEEMIVIVARTRAPLVYKKYPEKFQKRVNNLIATYWSMHKK